MAIIDANLTLDAASAIVDYDDTTAGTGDAAGTPSANVIDQGAKGDAMEEPLWLVVKVNTTFTSNSGSAALQAALQTCDTVGGTYTVVEESPLIAVASLVANFVVWKTKLPPGLKRFIRLAYKGAGGDFTAGKVDAYLTPDVEHVGQTLRTIP